MTTIDQQTIDRMNRWFAVEFNNRGWDLTAQATRTAEEDREMLECAYAASLHWGKVGQPINLARADVLIAHANSHLGRGEAALEAARRTYAFCTSNPCEDWDLAFAHAELAYAYAVAGERELSRQHHEQATTCGAAIAGEGDREVFLEEFERITAAIAAL